MNILDKIVAEKRRYLEVQKAAISLKDLEHRIASAAPTRSMVDALRSKEVGIIAEFKRKSPSKPSIQLNAKVEDVLPFYERGGAGGSSVLTDTLFFGGKDQDLRQARKLVDFPLLRKDFMVDPYQVYEARAMGADVILLIAAVLSPSEIKDLANVAKTLELEVLLEVHNLEELQRSLVEGVSMVGVNNRDLTNFTVSLDTSLALVDEIPAEFLKVSESGISDPSAVSTLKSVGYEGFLIGECFMKEDDPGKACQSFIDQVKNIPVAS